MDYLTRIVNKAEEIYSTFRDGINYLVNGQNLAYAPINGNYDPVTFEDNFLQGLEGITCFSKRQKGGSHRDKKKPKKKK